MSSARSARLAVLVLLGAPTVASGRAADPSPPAVAASPQHKAEVEQAELELEATEEEHSAATSRLDLSNLVTSAAKSVTTVQEAPAIVTVITAEDIRRRGYRTVNDVLADIPGWASYPGEHGVVTLPSVRGTIQAALLLRDGVSLTSPWEGVQITNRVVPLESIKRIEVVSGPGGVLWGANSFLGIINLITKDAEDVDGVEANLGYGDGPGNKSDLRGYVMAGKAFFGGRLKVFQHVSYESYVGPEKTMRQLVLTSPPPQPSGPASYGPALTSDIDRSWIAHLDGKYAVGPVSLSYNLPLTRLRYPLTFLGVVVNKGVSPTVGAGELPGLSPGSPRPFGPSSATDPYGLNRDMIVDWTDRNVLLDYKARSSDGKLGANAKAFLVDFNRDFTYFQILAASQLLPGGLTFRVDSTIRRYGSSLDFDVQATERLRLLVGGEGFRETYTNGVADFPAPEPGRLPFACPRTASGPTPSDLGGFDPGHAGPDGSARPAIACKIPFTFDADRIVGSGYANAQLRLAPSLMLDGGVRVQAAGGQRGYDAQFLRSGGLVWGFLPGWHAKVNYAEGFRPPVFNNTNSNGEAVEFAGRPNLEPETSRAGQVEINTRLSSSSTWLRDLSMRADVSYTVLDHVIVIADGRYQNSARRGITNGEFLAQLNLRGDHALQLGYTYLRVTSEDRGEWKSLPHNWVTANAIVGVLRKYLDVNVGVLVAASHEDPNRIPDQTAPSILPGVQDAQTTNLALDRIGSLAILQLGVRARNLFGGKVEIAANLYNALDQHYYTQDNFYELAPRLEMLPNPGDRIRFFAEMIFRP